MVIPADRGRPGLATSWRRAECDLLGLLPLFVQLVKRLLITCEPALRVGELFVPSLALSLPLRRNVPLVDPVCGIDALVQLTDVLGDLSARSVERQQTAPQLRLRH
jgi:hypothetical protein